MPRAKRPSRQQRPSIGHLRVLEEQVAYLKEQLAEVRAEQKTMLDRLLTKNHVEPIQPPAPSVPVVQVISPFGVTDPEVGNVMRETWIKNEMEYLMESMNVPPDLAEAQAERNFTDQHQVIS